MGIEGFATVDHSSKVYVEENCLVAIALALYHKTFTSSEYDEEMATALDFVLEAQSSKGDFSQYYDLEGKGWRNSGRFYYWNAYVIEALPYVAFQMRYYGNIKEDLKLAYYDRLIEAVKPCLETWRGAQEPDGGWKFEYFGRNGSRLQENAAMLNGLIYLALYEHFWGEESEAQKYARWAERTLDWVLSLQELNPESWGYGGFYQTKERTVQQTYPNAKAALSLNSYLRGISALKENVEPKYSKVRESISLWVARFLEGMLDEYHGPYNYRSEWGVGEYPKGTLQASALITSLVETWIVMGDLKYRRLAEKICGWMLGENEANEDLQNWGSQAAGYFREGFFKNGLIEETSVGTTASALAALINCVLIGIPELPSPHLILTLTVALTLFSLSNKFRSLFQGPIRKNTRSLRRSPKPPKLPRRPLPLR